MDDLGLRESVDRLGQGVVVTVTDAADRGLDPCLGKALCVFDGQILTAAIAVLHQPYVLCGAAIMYRLLPLF